MSEVYEPDIFLNCRLPIDQNGVVRLGHGSGGKMTDKLIQSIFLPALGNEELNQMEDAALVPVAETSIAISTDSYVVSPIFFPGGDISSLAVYGTVNDLAMRGAVPIALTAAFILEEGFSLADLRKLMISMGKAAERCGVKIVSADTKVVNRGAADKIFINTTGFGIVQTTPAPSVARACPGDYVMVSGDLGRHGIAIMASREGLDLETTIESDSAPLHQTVRRLLTANSPIHCLRDVTRGGLATVLNEIAVASNTGIEIVETAVPVEPQVKAVCELLGLDPLYVACEGRFVAVLPEESVNTLDLDHQLHTIGRVVADRPGRVVLRSTVGGSRILDKLAGEQLPRIC